ncbi:MAG: 2-keto-gluconate dehydrogenase [Acidobacteria bacterium]|nr:MAG: 2-keto-gluconate dehydrogenase [Acidobacteriota bacterium]
MARVFDLNDDGLVIIVGSGAGGGTLGNELARRGINTVILEAGPRIEREKHVDDERRAFEMFTWFDKRSASGSWEVTENWPGFPAFVCKVVGGTTVHWSAVSLRFQEHEFLTRDVYGTIPGTNLLNWPLTLSELEPYYDQAERKMGVSGTQGIPCHEASNNQMVLAAGARKIGYKECSTGNLAINSCPRDGRPATVHDGFCVQGVRSNAKWSTLTVEIPKGEATGNLEVRPESHVLKIEHNKFGKVSGVIYADRAGNINRQRARVVCLAGNSIETPRMLLNSSTSQFPDGLANSSGQVGKNYMRHTSGAVWGIFKRPVRMYRGIAMGGCIKDERYHSPHRGFAGGYYIQTNGAGLLSFASSLGGSADVGHWGQDFTETIGLYQNTAGIWFVGEDMPQEGNCVTLHSSERDQFNEPIPNVHFDDHPNDIAMRKHGFVQSATVFEAVGAARIIRVPPGPSTHNLGTCRQSKSPADGVCNKWGQTHDISNLFISDGSQFTTGAAANPTLTIVALAIRQAEYIADQMAKLGL